MGSGVLLELVAESSAVLSDWSLSVLTSCWILAVLSDWSISSAVLSDWSISVLTSWWISGSTVSNVLEQKFILFKKAYSRSHCL
jgi:hypothetical protein